MLKRRNLRQGREAWLVGIVDTHFGARARGFVLSRLTEREAGADLGNRQTKA